MPRLNEQMRELQEQANAQHAIDMSALQHQAAAAAKDLVARTRLIADVLLKQQFKHAANCRIEPAMQYLYGPEPTLSSSH